MAPRDLSTQRIHEVSERLAKYSPNLASTQPFQLAGLAKAVLSSVDVRDLKAVSTDELIEQLEYVLSTVLTRKSGEINTTLREHGEIIVVESCMDDQPFLVSALRSVLEKDGLEVRTALNAVAKLKRDGQGALVEFGTGTAESIIRVEAKIGPDGVPSRLQEKVHHRMRLAQAMVRDFESMKRHVQNLADHYGGAAARATGEESVALREAEGLLRWLCDENFVLFSVEEYDAEPEAVSTLGIASVQVGARDQNLIKQSATGEARAVMYQRSAEESPVHRAGKPGHFVITKVDRSGRPQGALVIDGLFTYKALHTPPEEVPYLRLLLRDMLADREVAVDSHRGKSITNAFNSLPIEYLLAESRENVWELTDRVLRAEEEGGSDVHIQLDEKGRFAFVFVTLPRWQFSEELRLQVQKLLLDELGGSYADYGVYIDRYENAIVHFYVTGTGPLGGVDTEKLRKQVHGLAKGWNERLREALSSLTEDENEIEQLFELYVDAFNEEHKRRAVANRVKGDIRCLETLRAGQPLDCDLFVSTTGEHPGSLNLRVFSREPLSLSYQLPVIGNFGFEVIDEYTREIRIRHLPTIEMHNFRLNVRRDRHRQLLGRHDQVMRTLRAVFGGVLGDDTLNRLVITTTLTGRDVEILRAFVAYLHQLRPPFADELTCQVLVDNPQVAQAAVGLLGARFDPAPNGGPSVDRAERAFVNELRAVTDYTADRVLSLFSEVIRATVRTNAFIASIEDGEALAFKIDARAISLGPEPKPFREIWVYHPEFEGVHLRGGLVARGGLRFSDRADDFRTEIHGLMATQMVKNVLIVPMGAKGGFIVRDAPAGRAELREAGDRYYKRFIKALLSVTDDVKEGKVVSPERIVHKEGEDAYLVVAADKGTAHLSDTANEISMSRGFWLDDAFASGGSNGYDHKATGITARGAWEATKRNFRELGIDPEADVITAIGVGDMSGDVFGNGLLRSKTIKLRAAFNHLHVFLDPDPDPASSFEERKRLFETPGSAWSDYDTGKLSSGGGVFSRRAKELPLSAEAREMLGFTADGVVNGDEVIRAVMRLSVDLFWMGGIGTYVKSRNESHADAGDKANDSVRIDASELRCRVFAEGANLAITDRGRVEFARGGGENYTAFLDNSGGVDVSDHEVNSKILFAPLLAGGSVTRDDRNALLRDVESEMCEMVLDNNRSQSRMVSYDVTRSRVDLWRYARTQRYLAQEVPFSPESFSMPGEDELSNRFRRGEGLHKCEAAVLGSHAKMLAYRQLLASKELPKELADHMVDSYFPAKMREAAGAAVHNHLLRRELASTMLVNRITDNAGASFFAEVMGSTGRSARDVAVAYLRAAEFGDLWELQRELYGLEDKHRQFAIYEAMRIIQRAMENATYFLLDTVQGDSLSHGDPGASRQMLGGLREWLQPGQLEALDVRRERLTDAGVPDELATRIRALRYLTVVLDALRLGRDTGRRPEEMLRIRLAVSSSMNLSALHTALNQIRFESPWDGPAMRALARQLEFHVHKMALLVEGDDVEGMIARYGLEPIRGQLLTHLEGELNIAAVVMIDNHLRRLLPPKKPAARR